MHAGWHRHGLFNHHSANASHRRAYKSGRERGTSGAVHWSGAPVYATADCRALGAGQPRTVVSLKATPKALTTWMMFL